MKRIFIFLITFAILTHLSPIQSVSAKVLPQARKATVQARTSNIGGGIGISVRLRGDRKALLVSFSNLQNATAVSYILTYQTRGQQEGAGGSVRPSEGNTATRELLFGTCSKNVCTYHPSITNMKFEVTAELKSGKKSIKRYKIRV